MSAAAAAEGRGRRAAGARCGLCCRRAGRRRLRPEPGARLVAERDRAGRGGAGAGRRTRRRRGTAWAPTPSAAGDASAGPPATPPAVDGAPRRSLQIPYLARRLRAPPASSSAGGHRTRRWRRPTGPGARAWSSPTRARGMGRAALVLRPGPRLARSRRRRPRGDRRRAVGPRDQGCARGPGRARARPLGGHQPRRPARRPRRRARPPLWLRRYRPGGPARRCRVLRSELEARAGDRRASRGARRGAPTDRRGRPPGAGLAGDAAAPARRQRRSGLDAVPAALGPHRFDAADPRPARRLAAGQHLPGGQADHRPQGRNPAQHPLPQLRAADGPGDQRRQARRRHASTVLEYRDMPAVGARSSSRRAPTTPATSSAAPTSPATCGSTTSATPGASSGSWQPRSPAWRRSTTSTASCPAGSRPSSASCCPGTAAT